MPPARSRDPLGLIIAADDGLFHALPGEPATCAVEGPRFTSLDYYDGLGIAGAPGEGAWVFAGRRWRQVWAGDARSVSVAPSGALFVGAGDGRLLRSTDPGDSWTEIASVRHLIAHHRFAPAEGEAAPVVTSAIEINDGLLIAIAGGGCWYSRSGGSWLPRSDGLHPAVHRLWIHPERSERLYATTDSGLFRSEDDGHTWVQSMGGLDRSWGGTLAVMPGAPDALVLSVARAAPGQAGALFRSANGGVTWTRVMLEAEGEWERIPVVTRPWDWEDVAFVSAGDSLWASHDRGRQWIRLGRDFPRANAMSAAL